jgi:hypothetical protein
MEAPNTPDVRSARRHERVAQACAIVLLALILAGTLVTGHTKQLLLSPFPPYLHADKLGHAIGFFGIGLASLRSRFAGIRPWHIVAFALALGVLTELCQRFIAGRTAKVSDVLIDVAAACAGVYLGSAFFPRPAPAKAGDDT